MPWYRLRIDWTYSSAASAKDALDAINATLAANGRPEQAKRTGKRVHVTIERATTALRDALVPSWAIDTRTVGFESLVQRDESST